MSRVAIFGDGYVRKLGCFEFSWRAGQIRFFGRDGMRAGNVPGSLWQEMRDYAPTHVFLLLGGNDISVSSDPATIARSLLDLAASLPDVAHVFVGEILPRGDFSLSPGLTPESFERQRHRVSRILRSSLGRRLVPFHIRLKYPDGSYHRDYCRDRVHLSEFGMRKCLVKLFRITRQHQN